MASFKKDDKDAREFLSEHYTTCREDGRKYSGLDVGDKTKVKCLLHYFVDSVKGTEGRFTLINMIPSLEKFVSKKGSNWSLSDEEAFKDLVALVNADVTQAMFAVRFLPDFQRVYDTTKKVIDSFVEGLDYK